MYSLLLRRQRHLQPQRPRNPSPPPPTRVVPSAPGSAAPSSTTSRANGKPGTRRPGRPLSRLLTKLRTKATPARRSSSWCSLWLWPLSSSAGSTWLKSTSLTMSCDQTNGCHPPPPPAPPPSPPSLPPAPPPQPWSQPLLLPPTDPRAAEEKTEPRRRLRPLSRSPARWSGLQLRGNNFDSDGPQHRQGVL